MADNTSKHYYENVQAIPGHDILDRDILEHQIDQCARTLREIGDDMNAKYEHQIEQNGPHMLEKVQTSLIKGVLAVMVTIHRTSY